MKKLLPLLATLTTLAGCFSFDAATLPRTGDEHLVASNYGWYLFGSIPLVGGNATNPETRCGPWAFFRDDVTMDKIQGRLTSYAATKPDRQLVDLVYHTHNEIFFQIPFSEIPLPIPYVICYRQIQLSGTLK